MQKNKLLLIGGIVLVLILFGGGLYFLSAKKTTKEAPVQEVKEEVIPTIEPSDIGLTLTPRADKNAIILEITKTEDLSGVDYELSYTAKGDIPRGAIGHIDIKDSKAKREILFGTCSDTCHYDEDVSNVKVVVKVTKKDGKVVQTQQAVEL